MATIELIPITPALIGALAVPPAFERAWNLRLGEYAELVAQTVGVGERFRQSTNAPPEWGGFLAVDAALRLVVGSCAFKGAPDADGRVEIAYFTFPAFERRGYATAMAEDLVARAFASGAVRLVFATTLPEPNASTRVLAGRGFTHVGDDVDDEVGRVWRWERAIEPAAR